METIHLKINGMTCNGCVSSINRVLEKLEGISEFSVSLETNSVSITLDTDKINISDVIQAIEDAGFDVYL